VLGYAQTLYVLPISLFGMSIAASELPELARNRGATEQAVAARVGRALRRVTYFIVPSAVAYIVLGDVLVAALFQRGAFDQGTMMVTSAVLAAYSLGLPASGSSRVLTSAFYALDDSRSPSRIAGLRVALSAVAGILFMIPLDRMGVGGLGLGAAGLALGASLGAWTEYVLLRRGLGRRVGPLGIGRSGAKIWLAAAAAGGVGILVERLVPAAHPVWIAVETLIPFGVVYLAGAALLGEKLAWRRSADA
jgi:putative peptidoglycan lipid II flippase